MALLLVMLLLILATAALVVPPLGLWLLCRKGLGLPWSWRWVVISIPLLVIPPAGLWFLLRNGFGLPSAWIMGWGFTVIGASYLKENGSFQGKDRELIGGDLWLRVAGPVELTGQAMYNQSMKEMASQRYAVRIVPGATFDISAGYESYTYKGLFQTALAPQFVFPSVDNNDKVQTFFGILDWAFVPGWTLEVAAKHIRHDQSDPGNANRGEVGVRYTYNDKKDVAGFSAAFVSADQAENEYQEYRGFASYSPSRLRVTLDALTQRYKEEINGKKNQYQVVGTVGYQVLAALQLSGNVTYTQSPSFEEDWAGLIRVTYDIAMSTGGKK